MLAVLAAALWGGFAARGAVPDAWDLETLTSNGVKVADWALAHPTRANHTDWTYGTFYAGLAAFALAHPDLPHRALLVAEGTNYAWRLEGGRPFYAESHGIGQAWLELARAEDRPAAVAGVRAVFDYVLANRSRAPVVQRTPNGTFSPNLLRWAWCDALFMSPPVWAKLAALTGEEHYRDFMISEFRASAARLYDAEACLFRRSYGAKVFWGRGNGWVLGGLPLVIRELPPDLRSTPYFVDLFRAMCAAVKAVQRDDGAWSPNLLDGADPDLPEMSGTALFCFALAWGVNEGILDEADYLPCVRKAWSAMCRAVSDEGRLGWVQQAAVGPTKNFTADSTALYAVGAYLLVSVEIRRHVVAKAHPAAKIVVVGPIPRFGHVTAQVPLGDLSPLSGDFVVFDERDGAFVPSQLWDADEDGIAETLIFRTSLGAGVPRAFRVFSGTSPRAAPVDLPEVGGFAYVRNGQVARAGEPVGRREIAVGPVRTLVEYTLPAVACCGASVTERRAVQFDRGADFVVCRSRFTIEGAEDLSGGPVLPVGDGEAVLRPRAGWGAASVGDDFSAVAVCAPAEVQSVGMGDLALVRALPREGPLTWLWGRAGRGGDRFATLEQWAGVVPRAQEDALRPPPVRVFGPDRKGLWYTENVTSKRKD
ncbi:MAG: glycoside hydrolase family 88 protein [Kiritimatiellia bacterium]